VSYYSLYFTIISKTTIAIYPFEMDTSW